MQKTFGLFIVTAAFAQDTCDNTCTKTCIKSCHADWYGFLDPTTPIAFCKWWYECTTDVEMDFSAGETA